MGFSEACFKHHLEKPQAVLAGSQGASGKCHTSRAASPQCPSWRGAPRGAWVTRALPPILTGKKRHKAANHKGKIIPHSAEITSNWSLVCNPSSFLGVSQLPRTPPQDGSFSKATNAQFIRELEPGSCAVSSRSLKGLNMN